MRKMNRSAFTLVELIVVITILAILGTIAFISLGGNVTKAKNAKVGEDLNNLASKINIVTTQDKSLSDVLDNNSTVGLAYSGSNFVTGTVNSGATLNSGTTTYKVGAINFKELSEKQANFQDIKGNDYVFAFVVDKDFVKFELAGNTYDQAGNPTVVLKSNYYTGSTSDVTGLISEKGESNTEPVATGDKKALY